MANLSKDFQCAGFDTQPPMLDRTDFASWQQRIRLYCQGKVNGVNILKSIDEGPFQMGTGRHNRGQGTNPQGRGAAGYEGVQNKVRNANPGQAKQDLALNVDNVFQADNCDTFDSDVDEAPTTQTMFMANLSSADPVYDEAGPSYDSDILSEIHNHDHYWDAVFEHHEEHAMHDDYVKNNTVSGVYSKVSSIPNDAYMMIYNDMYEPHAQSVSKTSRNTVVENSLTTELATYKEQVELYERRASINCSASVLSFQQQ
nr:integrase, catalytic region, zinc finger, CCHC-type, peptidase aspartic, catalytic [Tanacetum cinerariifolium]